MGLSPSIKLPDKGLSFKVVIKLSEVNWLDQKKAPNLNKVSGYDNSVLKNMCADTPKIRDKNGGSGMFFPFTNVKIWTLSHDGNIDNVIISG